MANTVVPLDRTFMLYIDRYIEVVDAHTTNTKINQRWFLLTEKANKTPQEKYDFNLLTNIPEESLHVYSIVNALEEKVRATKDLCLNNVSPDYITQIVENLQSDESNLTLLFMFKGSPRRDDFNFDILKLVGILFATLQNDGNPYYYIDLVCGVPAYPGVGRDLLSIFHRVIKCYNPYGSRYIKLSALEDVISYYGSLYGYIMNNNCHKNKSERQNIFFTKSIVPRKYPRLRRPNTNSASIPAYEYQYQITQEQFTEFARKYADYKKTVMSHVCKIDNYIKTKLGETSDSYITLNNMDYKSLLVKYSMYLLMDPTNDRNHILDIYDKAFCIIVRDLGLLADLFNDLEFEDIGIVDIPDREANKPYTINVTPGARIEPTINFRDFLKDLKRAECGGYDMYFCLYDNPTNVSSMATRGKPGAFRIDTRTTINLAKKKTRYCPY